MPFHATRRDARRPATVPDPVRRGSAPVLASVGHRAARGPESAGRRSVPAFASAALAAAAVTVLLAGCTSGSTPAPTASSTSSDAQTATPTPTVAPAFVPDGTAAENLPYFDYVNNQTISQASAQNQTADGVAFTTALRSGGFAVADMQVTPDVTTVGVKADSIQFSVAMKGQCLIGQYGFGAYHSLIAPVLGTGKCLVGDTRTIDW